MLIPNKPMSNLETWFGLSCSLNFKDIKFKLCFKQISQVMRTVIQFSCATFWYQLEKEWTDNSISIFYHHILRSVRTCEYNHDFMGVEWLKTSSHLLEWLNKIELMKMVFSLDKMLSTAWKPFVHAMFLARNILMGNPSVDVSAAIDNVRRTLSSTMKWHLCTICYLVVWVVSNIYV